MAVYFANTEITGIKDLFPLESKDITGLYFASTELFTVWGEYDGTLPATYSANGSMLADYRVHGANGGAGNRTENLYDITTQIPVSANSNKSGYIHVEAGTTYTMWHDKTDTIERALQICDSSKAVIAQVPITPRVNSFTFNTNNSAAYVVIIYPAKSTQVMFVEGSTAPSEYVPYGYEVDMSVSDGTTSTTIVPIYIGDDPLGEDEYVDYAAGKVYRRTEQLFNKNATDARNGYVRGKYFYNGEQNNSNWNISEYIAIAPNETYTVKNVSASSAIATCAIYNSAKQYLSQTTTYDSSSKIVFTAPQDAAFVRISYREDYKDTATFTKGSTAPEQYIPYLQPTDPPVPLPALPTVDGTNIVDYAGQSAAVPSRFYAKYRKEGFK